MSVFLSVNITCMSLVKNTVYNFIGDFFNITENLILLVIK